MNFRHLPVVVMLISITFSAYTQIDTIITFDENILVGKLKNMDRGVATFETSYSDKDFKIEWNGIQFIKTETEHLLTTAEGHRHLGRMESDSLGNVSIVTGDGRVFVVEMSSIVLLSEVERDFWSRLYYSIEFGFSFTKARNLTQFTSRSSLGYVAETWSTGGSFNTLQSSQDSTEDISRSDGEVNFRYFLPKDWYLTSQVNFLSNSEQKLELRTNLKFGLGKFLLHTNRSYWGFSGGGAYNIERFTSEDPERISWEGYFGSELNLYDIGDLSLLTNIVAYPSITEAGRWRADGQFDLKYDFPLDFYIKLGFSFNYDNRPVEGASETDYVFQTTLGWEL